MACPNRLGGKFFTDSLTFLEEDIDIRWTSLLGSHLDFFNSGNYNMNYDKNLNRIGLPDLLALTTAMTIGKLIYEKHDTDCLAIEFRGVIIADMIATRQRLDVDACFVRFFPGLIKVGGENCEKIGSKVKTLERTYGFVDFGHKSVLKPIDAFTGLEVIVRAEISGISASLSLDMLIDGELLQTDFPLPDSTALASTYVTQECGHSYYNEYPFNPSYPSQIWGMRVIPDGFSLKQCYLQQVDQNPCGQWMACMNANKCPEVVSILQRGTCLQCVVERFGIYESKLGVGQEGRGAIIIPGHFI